MAGFSSSGQFYGSIAITAGQSRAIAAASVRCNSPTSLKVGIWMSTAGSSASGGSGRARSSRSRAMPGRRFRRCSVQIRHRHTVPISTVTPERGRVPDHRFVLLMREATRARFRRTGSQGVGPDRLRNPRHRRMHDQLRYISCRPFPYARRVARDFPGR